jgi:hypothetical protein
VIISSKKCWLKIYRISLVFFFYLHFVIQGLEVNADKTKNVVMSRDQTAGQNHSMKTDNSSFERV